MRIELVIPDKETSDVFEAALAYVNLSLRQVTNAESDNRLFHVVPIPAYLRPLRPLRSAPEGTTQWFLEESADLGRRIAQARCDAVNARSEKL